MKLNKWMLIAHFATTILTDTVSELITNVKLMQIIWSERESSESNWVRSPQ